MRADRLLSLYLFRPLHGIRRSRSKLRLPILMYHSISAQDENRRAGYYGITTSPGVFAAHMEYLKREGYRVIPLQNAVRRLTADPAGETTTDREVVLTFDDGYQDFYSQALPILRSCGYPATVFLPAGFIGRDAQTLKGQKHLTWGEINELQKEGITFGSHTVNHPQLRGIPERKLQYEVKVSKKRIEDRIGRPVASFSYPFAFPEEDRRFVDRLEGVLREAGYTHGVSTRIGTSHSADERYFLRRLPINDGDDPPLFRAKLMGHYDGLHFFQFLSKWARFQGKGHGLRNRPS